MRTNPYNGKNREIAFGFDVETYCVTASTSLHHIDVLDEEGDNLEKGSMINVWFIDSTGALQGISDSQCVVMDTASDGYTANGTLGTSGTKIFSYIGVIDSATVVPTYEGMKFATDVEGKLDLKVIDTAIVTVRLELPNGQYLDVDTDFTE